MNRWTCWAPALLAAVAGCESEPTRDVFSADGIVRGTVTASVEGPVPDAWVAVAGTYPLGSGNFEALYDSVRTDAGGHYVARVGVLNLPDATANVTVRVWPPAAAGLAPATSPDLTVRLTADLPPADTLVVDFELDPAS